MKLPAEEFGIRVAAAAARSVGVALAFAIFAAALLGSAPVWSQSASVLSFVAVTTDTTAEGGDDLALRIGLPPSDVGSRVEIELTVIGTALAGSDYTLVAADSTPAITLGAGGNSTLTLSVESAPAELSLRLRPRADDRISQGDRLLNLRLSRYRVEPASGGAVDLPPALDLTIRDDEPPTVQQLQVRERALDNKRFACVLSNGGALRCEGDNTDGQSTPPADLPPVAQFGLGDHFGCALTILGKLRCWGREKFNETASPADDLGPFTQLVVSGFRSCALTDSGQPHCWGEDGDDGLSSPPVELGPDGTLGAVAQVVLGNVHSCALTVGGEVHCWGSNRNHPSETTDSRTVPPDDLGLVMQLALGDEHSCALQRDGQVRCWGKGEDGSGSARSVPPSGLSMVAQLGVGLEHTCALTELGALRCWGVNVGTESMPGTLWPPADLGSVAEIMVGNEHTCVRTVAGLLRCWGDTADEFASLPPGLVTAIDFSGDCALLADGSVVCPTMTELIPLELSPGEAVMSVWQRQLQPGQRAAIRFADLRDTAGAFSARIEVFGDGAADVSSYYRLLDHNGRPLSAERDGSYRLGRKPLPIAGEPPMGWLEATLDGRGSRLYVRPLELRRSPVRGSARAPSIRMVAQPVELVELSDRPFLTASADTLTEGAEEVQLSIWLPPAHIGLRVEMELLVSGTAMAGADYTLVAADSTTKITFAGEANVTTRATLVVESASTPLRLRLLPRAADRISQGPRLLKLRISRYRVAAEGGGAVDPPPALDLIIVDDEPPTVQQVQVGKDFACILLTGGQLRCVGDNSRDRATPDSGPDGTLGLVAQVSLSNNHGCAVTVFGEVRCWGLNGVGQASPPDDLGAAVQVGVNGNYSCALTVAGEVRCWGLGVGTDDDRGDLWPPAELGPDGALGAVVRFGLGRSHVCALTASGEVRCWGNPGDNLTSPPDDLGPDGALGAVAQLAVGDLHNCVVTDLAQVHCWGTNGRINQEPDGRATPPDDLGAVVQLGVGDLHSCALTVSGEVRCWGANGNPNRGLDGRATPPDDLGQVAQITVGEEHTCALTVAGAMRCWGDVIDVSSLPPGAVTAVDFSGLCALLADGSLYCPNDLNLAPSELRPGAVVMSVWPRQLRPGQRAAIRFADRRNTAGAFTARIEVFGEGTAEIGSDYRLLDSDGRPVEAEPNGSYLLGWDPNSPNSPNSPQLAGNSLAGNSLEALVSGRLSRLYVRPIELLVESGSVPSIRKVAQPVELIDGPFLAASTATLVEGGEELPLSIWLPLAHTGLAVELELTAGGNALAGSDYTLDVADSEQGIMLGGGLDSTITLRVDSAPTEPLRLRLRPRTDDRISQGDRLLNLRLSGYRVVSETTETVDLPPALDLTIRDNDPPVTQWIVGGGDRIICARLNGGSLRCWGDENFAIPPDDLGAVAQMAADRFHACAVTVSGRVRCWGGNEDGQSTPPDDLGPVAQLDVGRFHSCAVTVLGEVRCWGAAGTRIMPPAELGPGRALGPVAQVSLGNAHSCALTVSGEVRCWGFFFLPPDPVVAASPDDLGPVAQLASGDAHSCALTVLGQLRCWGSNEHGRSTPPDGLEPVVQLGVGYAHSCVRTVSGRVHCWGNDEDARSTPPEDLGPVMQLEVALFHNCARTVSGRLRCWGAVSRASSSLPPDMVTAVDPSGRCALLAEGSVYCTNRRVGTLLLPLELRPGDVAMSVWPRQLGAGERAAIRFADLRETTAAFTARIEVFGDGSEDVGSDYRLLDGSGVPLVAEDDGSYLLEWGSPNSPQLAGNSLESLAGDRSLRLYVRPLELLPVSGPTPTIRVVAQPIELAAEVLGSLTVTGPSSTQMQTVPAEAVLFELTVTAAGSNGTRPWQPTEVLRLQHAAAPGVVVVFDSTLRFTAGVATVTVTVTPSPGTDAVVTFSVGGEPADLAAVVVNMLTVNVRVAEVLSAVTLTVPGERLRTVRSGQEEVLITVQLMTEYLIATEPEQTRLRLRAVATNGVEVSGPVDVVVPAGGATTTTLSLILGTARQTTVSFEVVGLPSGASLFSPEVRVELVPVPASLELSALPQAVLALEPRAEAVAEFRVRVAVQGSDDRPLGGLSDLVLSTTVTAVAAGEAGDLAFLSAALEESAAGVYESTVRVTIAAGQVSTASVEITVVAGGTGGPSAAVTVQLARRVTLDSLTLSLSDASLEQLVPGASVQTTATVTARDQFGDAFSPAGLRLSVVDTAAETEVLVTTPALVFDAGGEAQSLLSLTPPPATNQDLRVELVGVTDPEVNSNTATLTLIAAGVLSTVTLTVPDGLIRTVESGQELLTIEVRLVTEYLGENDPEQTTLLLRAVATNGVEVSDPVAVVVPAGGATTTTLSLMLGTARQTTVSFEVVGLPSGASLISPELRVELVPVPASLELSALPQAMLELAPRAEAVAEFRVRVEVQGSDGQPLGGLNDLVLGTTVTEVVAGEAGDLAFLSAALEESAAGVYESTLRVTIAAGQVRMASVEITVAGGGLAGVSTSVQLARRVTLDSLTLSLSDASLEQLVPGASVQTTATVTARDQFGDAFSPAGLRLRVVDTADGSVVLVTTPELVFDAGGEVQEVLELTPPRGTNQDLRVELVGVTDAEVSTDTVDLRIDAAEVLGLLTVTGPSSTPMQTMRDEAVVFELTVTAAGSNGTEPWQPTELLILQHTAGPGVMVDYDPMLRFKTAGVATVAVSVTPDPGNDALVTFSVTTQDPADVADLIGVAISPAEVSVGAVEVLSTVTLTVPGGLLRTPGSGQEDIPITVELMTESFGGDEARRRELTLRAVATNGVEASADVVVVIDNGFGTAVLSLMLGDAEQTTVSFEVVDLPSGASLISQEVRVELVVVPASLALSAMPALIDELPPSGEVTAEFRVKAEVLGSDGQPFGGLSDLVLAATVTDMAVRPDVELFYGLLEETEAGVYESTVMVTILAANRASVSVEITVAGGGLAGVSTSVRLVRQAILDSLVLSLSDASPEQSASGESVQTVATVMARDQFGDAFSPAGLRLRVVATDDESEILVTTPALVFDAGGEAREVLILTPPRGIDQSLWVELVGVTDAEVMSNTETLTLIAAEALDLVILTVPGGSVQLVSSTTFSVTLELTLVRAGDRPLTAATALTVQLQVEIVGGALLSSPSFSVSVSGAGPSIVEIDAMFSGNASLATLMLSVVGGVPAGSSVAIQPANTVRVRLPADLDVDDNAVFDVRDAVLLLKAADMSLPNSTPEHVKVQLDELLSPSSPDIRLDVDGNNLVEPIDVRVLLRYLAGLRGDSLIEDAVDTEAIERRAREIIDSLR